MLQRMTYGNEGSLNCPFGPLIVLVLLDIRKGRVMGRPRKGGFGGESNSVDVFRDLAHVWN